MRILRVASVTLAGLLCSLLSLGLAPTTAVAGPVVTDLPTLSIQVDPTHFAAVNGDPVHETTAQINLEVTDPGNPWNNLTVSDGLTEIRGRGNYSWTLPSEKKPYQIKFADGQSRNLLGMGSARTWVLLANTLDPSLMRNKVALDLAEEFGLSYTSESRWVDLVVNGQPWGNYLLTEKNEVKKTRVALKHSQGVLVEQDYNYGSGDPVYHRTPRGKSYFVLSDSKEGNPDTLAEFNTSAFANARAGWNDFVAMMDSLDVLLADPNANWNAISQIIDVDSFVKMFLVYEFTENQEIARSSVYFYRDGPTDKIHAGPVWDFDVAMGNFDDSLYGRGGNPEVDYVANVVAWRPDGLGNDWFPQLLKGNAFNARVYELYPTLRSRIDDVPSKISGYREYLNRSAAANFARWPGILGGKTLLPYGSRRYASTFGGEVDRLMGWIVKRVNYMDHKYAGTSSAVGCVSSTSTGPNHAPGTFNATAPCRMLDTRAAVGLAGTTPIPAGGEIALKVAGRGGVPATASSAALNVTVANPTATGHLTIYPAGRTLPLASNLNFVAGQVVANQVIASIGSDGFIRIHNGSSGTVHVVADVTGYFAGGGDPTLAGAYQSSGPVRILDTREGDDLTDGLAVGHDKEVVLPITGTHELSSGSIVVPADVSAVVLNVTVAQPSAAGYVTVYPTGATRPIVSNLNFTQGQGAVPNLVSVKVGHEGSVSLYVNTESDTSGAAHMIADLTGYYLGGDATQPGTFVAVSPKRILDSRLGAGMVPKLAIDSLARKLNNYETISLDVAATLSGESASTVAAIVMNTTVTEPTAFGYSVIYPTGTNRPYVSSLNFAAGATIPNLVTVPTGATGRVDLYTFSAGQTHLIADVAGYYRK